MKTRIGVALAMICWSVWMAGGCSSTEHGPKIYVDLNTRQLLAKGFSGEKEERCQKQGDVCPASGSSCPQATPFCWCSADANFTRGFCHQCKDSNQCEIGLNCDFGWCHKACTASSDCQLGICGLSNHKCAFPNNGKDCSKDSDCQPATDVFCSGGFCRPPIRTEISFDNVGDRPLEIYPKQLELHGNEDACAFGRVNWNTDLETITVDSGAFVSLQINFTPPSPGTYRAYMVLHSNDPKIPALPLLFCGQAVEAECTASFDICPQQISCTENDFKDLIASNPDCSSYK